jgi:hypothetical protein
MSQRAARARARRRAHSAQPAEPLPAAAQPVVVARSWPLTAPLTLEVLLKLPLLAKVRAREVCRAWRAELSRPELWAVLDATADSRYRESVTALRVASRLAAAGVRELHIPASLCSTSTTGREYRRPNIAPRVLDVIKANAQSLRVLRVVGDDSCIGVAQAMYKVHAIAEVMQLLQAAPWLERLEMDVRCESVEQALGVLRNVPPFGPLRVRRLCLPRTYGQAAVAFSPHDWARLVAAMAQAPASFTQLCIEHCWALRAADLESLATMAVSRRLPALRLSGAFHSAAQLVHWTRLVRDGAPAELELSFPWWTDMRAAAADWQRLCAALRRCTTLRRLRCEGLDAAFLWMLIAALEGHASVETLHIAWSGDSHYAIGAAFAQLVAADAPALRTLRVAGTLTEKHARPLLLALPRNTHLHTLQLELIGTLFAVDPDGHLPNHAFLEDVLRPAVRANCSLRTLKLLPPGAAELLQQYVDAPSWRKEEVVNAFQEAWLWECDHGKDFKGGRLSLKVAAYAHDCRDAGAFDAIVRSVTLLADLEEEVRFRAHVPAAARCWTVAYDRWIARAAAEQAARAEQAAEQQRRQAAIAAADAAMAALVAEEEAERAARRAPPPSRKSKGKKPSAVGHGGGGSGGAAAAAATSSEAQPGAAAMLSLSPPPGLAADAMSAAVSPAGSSITQQSHASAIGAGEAAGSIDAAVVNAAAAVSSGGSGAFAAAPAVQAAHAESSHAAPAAATTAASTAPRSAPRAYQPPVGGASPFYYDSAAPAAASALPPLPLHFAALSLSTPPQLPPPLPPLPPAAAPAGPPAAHCGRCACAMPALCAHCHGAMTSLRPPEVECCICFLKLPLHELRLLAPCGHRCVCGDCAGALLAAARGCPFCGVPVICATRVFDL